MPQDDSGVALSPTRKQLSVVLKCKGNVCLLRFQNCKTNGSCGRKGSVLNGVLFFFFCKDRNSTPTGLRKKEKDRSAVFKELYDQTSAHSQRALYSWMAGILQTSSNATGEPALWVRPRSRGSSSSKEVLHIWKQGFDFMSLIIFPAPQLPKRVWCGLWNKTHIPFHQCPTSPK